MGSGCVHLCCCNAVVNFGCHFFYFFLFIFLFCCGQGTDLDNATQRDTTGEAAADGEGTGANIGAIVGGVIGAIVFIAIIAVVIFYFVRRRGVRGGFPGTNERKLRRLTII